MGVTCERNREVGSAHGVIGVWWLCLKWAKARPKIFIDVCGYPFVGSSTCRFLRTIFGGLCGSYRIGLGAQRGRKWKRTRDYLSSWRRLTLRIRRRVPDHGTFRFNPASSWVDMLEIMSGVFIGPNVDSTP